MQGIKLRDEYIKLSQVLEAANLVEPGVDVEFATENGLAKVNGEMEYWRGKGLRDGDVVAFDGESIQIKS